jgi:hypothetical protein
LEDCCLDTAHGLLMAAISASTSAASPPVVCTAGAGCAFLGSIVGTRLRALFGLSVEYRKFSKIPVGAANSS